MKRLRQFLKGMTVEERSLLGFATVLILLLSLVIFAFVPLMEEALLAKEQASKLEARLVLYEDLSRQKNYMEFTKEQKRKLEALEKRLPKNLQQEEVMAELHTAAERCGVKLKGLKAVRQGSNQKQSLHFQMNCQGNYEDVLKFLRLVENEGSFKTLQDFVAKGDEKNGSLDVGTVVLAYKN